MMRYLSMESSGRTFLKRWMFSKDMWISSSKGTQKCGRGGFIVNCRKILTWSQRKSGMLRWNARFSLQLILLDRLAYPFNYHNIGQSNEAPEGLWIAVPWCIIVSPYHMMQRTEITYMEKIFSLDFKLLFYEENILTLRVVEHLRTCFFFRSLTPMITLQYFPSTFTRSMWPKTKFAGQRLVRCRLQTRMRTSTGRYRIRSFPTGLMTCSRWIRRQAFSR